MILRTVKREAPRQGEHFWGCPHTPAAAERGIWRMVLSRRVHPSAGLRWRTEAREACDGHNERPAMADYLQLAPDTVYRHIREAKLVASKLGRQYRVPRKSVELILLATPTAGPTLFFSQKISQTCPLDTPLPLWYNTLTF
jgi:excisionase family DNA binding protein